MSTTEEPIFKTGEAADSPQAGRRDWLDQPKPERRDFPIRKKHHVFGMWMIIIAFFGILFGFGITQFLKWALTKAEKSDPPKPVPAVEVQPLQVGPIRLSVQTQATVRAHRRSVLSAEVSGRVIETSPAVEEGGIFQKGEMLVRLDPTDYKAAVLAAEANLARAKADLQTEEAESEQARLEWKKMGRGEAPPLALREPQMAQANAALKSSESALAKARYDLERTKVLAPYDGRSIDKMVDLGHFVTPGRDLAEIFSTDFVEVRLPLSAAQVENLDLGMSFDQNGLVKNGPGVELSSEIGKSRYVWQGQIVRTEGVVDPQSRFYYLIARVDDPYGYNAARQADRELGLLRLGKEGQEAPPERAAPLLIGMFVQARVQGRTVEGVARIPRVALRQGDIIWIVKDNRITSRQVEVVAAEKHHVIIRGDFSNGEILCTTPLAITTENMEVQVIKNQDKSKNPQVDAANSENSST